MSAEEQLRRASRGAGRYARMTAQDVAALGAVFVQVASRQARDAAGGAGGLLARTLRRGRRSGGPRT